MHVLTIFFLGADIRNNIYTFQNYIGTLTKSQGYRLPTHQHLSNPLDIYFSKTFWSAVKSLKEKL